MRKGIFLFILFIAAMKSYGQPPILTNSWLPVSGDTIMLYSLYYNENLDYDDTGINVTWNLSALQKISQSPIYTYYFKNPSQVTFSCANASVNLVAGNTISHACYLKNGTGLHISESYWTAPDTSIGPIHTKYSNPETLIRTNFQFRNLYNDTAISVHNNGKEPSPSDTFRGKLTAYEKYDGYGALQLLGKTYDSVIHTFRTRLDKDSVPKTGGGYTVGGHYYKEYFWYVKSIHWPVLQVQIAYTLYNGTDTAQVQYMVIAAEKPSSSGMRIAYPKKNFIEIFVEKNNIFLTNNSREGESLEYNLYDISGRPVKSGDLDFAPGSKNVISATGYSKGVYILLLRDRSGNQSSHKVLIK
jgi:hypothetical protein